MEDLTRRSLTGGLIGSLVAGSAVASIPDKEHKIPSIDKFNDHGPFAGSSLSKEIIWASCASNYKANDIIYHTRYKIIPLRHVFISQINGVDKIEHTAHSITVTGSYFADKDDMHSQISEILFKSDEQLRDEYNKQYNDKYNPRAMR